VIDYLLAVLCCATKQNKKNQKQFEKIYNWSKQMVDWNIKKELSQKSKELFPRQRSSDNYEFLTGAYNPHLQASYVCMYVCMCAFFTNLFRGTYLIG
jgi:hypothetical protein